MDLLVLAPFRDMVGKGTTALARAQLACDRADPDAESMRRAAQSLVREGERALKRVEPVCRRLLDEYADVFVNALRDNEEIRSFRKSLNDLLYDFDEYLEPGQFNPAVFAELQALSREVAPALYEILINMRLEHPLSSPEPTFSVASNLSRAASSTTSHLSEVIRYVGQQSSDLDLHGVGHTSPDPSPQDSTLAGSPAGIVVTGQQAETEAGGHYYPACSPSYHNQPALPSASLQPLPSSSMANPQTAFSRPPLPPPVLTRGAEDMAERHIPGAHPAGMLDGQQQHAISPLSPHRREAFFYFPHQSNNDGRSGAGAGQAAAADASPPPQPRHSSTNSGSDDGRGRFQHMLNMIPEATMAPNPEARGAITLPGRAGSPDLTSPLSPRPLSLNNRGRSRDSWMTASSATPPPPPPVYQRRPPPAPAAPPSAAGQTMMMPLPLEPRPEPAAAELGPGAAPVAGPEPEPERAPVRPPPDHEGPIPVSTEPALAALRMPREPDCRIDATSSFHLMKELCEGAKEIINGRQAFTKATQTISMMGHVAKTCARCSRCAYRLDWELVKGDVAKKKIVIHCNGIDFRPRFLQKSHLHSKYHDEPAYACLFCVHAGQTLEESDATVFFTQKRLFKHIARHPRPLPEVPGVVAVDNISPAASRSVITASAGGLLTEGMLAVKHNDYDLVLKRGPERSQMASLAPLLADMPRAVAAQAYRPDRTAVESVRAPPDGAAALSLAAGQRVVGIQFPDYYQGEWAVGWADDEHAVFPLDVIRLQAPPRELVRAASAGGSSSLSVIARWRRVPREGGDTRKGREAAVQWLKFDSGEVIQNISYPNVDYWCWSGYNARGKWGIFPKAFIDHNTLKEEMAKPREGMGNGRGAGEVNGGGGGFLSRISGRRARKNRNNNNSGRPGSAAESQSSAEVQPPTPPTGH